MVDLPITHAPRAPSHSGVAAIVDRISGFFAMSGADIRVARAVEARREPHPADLQLLGVRGRLPKGW